MKTINRITDIGILYTSSSAERTARLLKYGGVLKHKAKVLEREMEKARRERNRY